MSNQFHIEEFSEYKVFLYDRPSHGDDIDESIVIPYSEGDVYFIFYSSGEHQNETKGKAPNLKSYIYIRSERFPRFIDILRHEKPLYIAVDSEEHSAYITTELEPVGEGDEDQS
ncbi:MAG TPA: hypothetical protein VJ917_08095 [Saprospiraceae bacterium]|nr:hypothetical protein [Saprospiraceae bacterium]